MRIMFAAASAILALSAVFLGLPATEESDASGSISLIYIDTDITGNEVTHIDTDGDTNLDAESVSLGPVDECAEIAVGEEITIDIVAADWPGGVNLVGVEFILEYDESIVSREFWVHFEFPVLGGDPQRLASPLDLSDKPLVAAAMPFNKHVDEDIDGEASSHGPLARFTVTGMAVGQTTISVTAPGAFAVTHAEDGRYVPVDVVHNGFVSVGQPCVPGSQPGPPPGPPQPPACGAGLPDSDGDGFSNCAELHIGTDWSDACVSAFSDPLQSGWPIDFTDNGVINISDILEWGKFYHFQGGDRFDLDTDGVNTLLDGLFLWENFGLTCTNTPPIPCASPPWWTHPPPWPLPAGDVDCDGFSSTNEGSIGTDPDEDCGFTAGGDPASESWPADLVESNRINISDVLALKPVFGSAVPPTSARYDIVPSGGINISDVLALKPFFGKACPT